MARSDARRGSITGPRNIMVPSCMSSSALINAAGPAMQPPTMSPLPHTNFLRDDTTTSAPSNAGQHKNGAKVLSTTSTTPCLCAIAASVGMSAMHSVGLDMVSTYSTLVLVGCSVTACSTDSTSSMSTKVVVIPQRVGSRQLSTLVVPHKDPAMRQCGHPNDNSASVCNILLRCLMQQGRQPLCPLTQQARHLGGAGRG